MRFGVCLLMVLISAGLAFGQEDPDFDIGRPAELKGKTTIYIDAGTDLQNRDRVTREIQKDLKLQWVEDREDADIYIMMRAERGQYGVHEVLWARILVFVRGKSRPRLVMSYENKQETAWEQKPTTKFAKMFVKAYREAQKSR